MKSKTILIIAIVMVAAFAAFSAPLRVWASCQIDQATGENICDDSGGSGGSTPSSSGEVNFGNPLGDTDTIPLLIDQIKNWLTGIISGLAVMMIMVGGLMYIVNSGNAAKAEKAKDYIKYSVTGLVIVLSVNMIITEINRLIGIDNSGTDTFFNFATRFINWIIVIIAGLAVIFLMYAGYTYMSPADSKNPEKAKAMIKYTVIGLIVALLSYAIVSYVVTWFGA